MNLRLVPFVLVALVLASSQAHAVKVFMTLSPDSCEGTGFSVEVDRKTDDTVTLTVERDLSKVQSFELSSELEIERNATLTIDGAHGLLLKCRVEPDSNRRKPRVLTYRIKIARHLVADAVLTIAEIEAYKDKERPYIGGGSIFELPLGKFAKAK